MDDTESLLTGIKSQPNGNIIKPTRKPRQKKVPDNIAGTGKKAISQEFHGDQTGIEPVKKNAGYKNPPVKHRFTSEKQPANRGRYPSKLNGFIKDNKIDCTDVAKIIKNVIFEHSESELMDMLKDKDQPMLIRLFVRAYIEDFKNGALSNIETLLNRAVGRPKVDMEVNAIISGDIDHNVIEMTPEQRKKRIDELLKKRKGK